MKMKQRLHILGGERFNFDGSDPMARLFVLEDETPNSSDRVGRMTMVAQCPYDLLDKLQSVPLPAELECTAELVAGKAKTAALYIHDIQVPVTKG